MSFEDKGFTEVNRGQNTNGGQGEYNQRPAPNNYAPSYGDNNRANTYGGDSGSQNSAGGFQGGGYKGGSNSNGGNRGNWNSGGGGGYRGGNGGSGGGFQKGNFQRGNFQRNQEPEGPVELFMPYVGTGNREAPNDVLETMKRIAADLESRGYTLRSGGTEGPEDVFEKACKRQEIHLPWRGFLEKESKFTFTTEAAKILASRFHPSYDGLKPAFQIFLAKNVRMIMGKDLKAPALFMVTWSEDGAETLQEKSAKTGNTGHAIAIACALRIPVFNLGKPGAEARLKQYLGTNSNEQKESPGQQPIQQPAQQSNQQPAYQQGSNYDRQSNY